MNKSLPSKRCATLKLVTAHFYLDLKTKTKSSQDYPTNIEKEGDIPNPSHKISIYLIPRPNKEGGKMGQGKRGRTRWEGGNYRSASLISKCKLLSNTRQTKYNREDCLSSPHY